MKKLVETVKNLTKGAAIKANIVSALTENLAICSDLCIAILLGTNSPNTEGKVRKDKR